MSAPGHAVQLRAQRDAACRDLSLVGDRVSAIRAKLAELQGPFRPSDAAIVAELRQLATDAAVEQRSAQINRAIEAGDVGEPLSEAEIHARLGLRGPDRSALRQFKASREMTVPAVDGSDLDPTPSRPPRERLGDPEE